MTTSENTNSNKYFYRFRSINNLLGDRKELEKQQIYFASQDQLNDPLEGHINIYWQGDPIVWRNLLKNYLFSLLHTYNLWSLFNEADAVLEWVHIPARNPLQAGIFSEHHEIETTFFNDPDIRIFTDRIVNSVRITGRNELTAHLRTVHYFVIGKIDEIYRKRHANANPHKSNVASVNLSGEIDRIRSAVKMFDVVEKTLGSDTRKIEAHYGDILSKYEEIDLLNYYTDAINLAEKNRIFIANDFCQAYVRRLGTLMYPSWYTACFMEDCSAASMWAYYGDSHAGVCLKFKAENRANGPSIDLNTISSYGSTGKSYSMSPHLFKPVLYQTRHETLNFFETLGAAPVPVLNAQWYTNDKKEISPLLLRTEAERDIWRKDYWDRFGLINKTKTQTWEAEREHRLIYYSMIADLTSEDRTLKYDFSSLEGIIFGVRTPTIKKIEIMKTIEKKCRENARFDFKFYQASFSTDQNEMTFSEIRTSFNTL
jgi:hypothetical protein